MSIKKLVVRNAAWNWAGMAVNMVAGFATAPFLVRHLGETNYGLWIMIASFTSYFGMLDLGVRGAVGRQIAFYKARGDWRGTNAILSTALVILSAAGVLALLASLGAATVITRLFAIPPDQVGSARLALALIGLNLALSLPLNVFDATLWAYQRFDLLNVLDIAAALFRTGLTFTLIDAGHGIVTLAWLNLITQAGAQTLKGLVSWWLDPGLRAGFAGVGRGPARDLMGYGVWSFLISASKTLTTQVSPLVIGARLGIGLVTPFSIATRLIGYSSSLIVAGTGVLTPVATRLHAEGGHDRQRWMLVEGGRYCLSLSLYFVTFFVLLGRPLIVSWMGPGLASSASLLTILALGEALPMSQWITHGIILGMGRHRPLALAVLAECAMAVVLSVSLAFPYGLAGVSIALAIPATLCRGFFPLIYGCSLVGISLREYLTRAVAPAIAAATIPAGVSGLAIALRPPLGSLEFLAYGCVYSVLYVVSCLVLVVGLGRVRELASGMVRKRSGEEAR